MPTSRTTTILAWILAVLLSAFFGFAALGKLTGAMTPAFEAWGYPAWFALAIGVVEAAGALGLLIPKTTRCAVALLALVMLGATYTHLANGEGLQILRPLVALALLGALYALRRPNAEAR